MEIQNSVSDCFNLQNPESDTSSCVWSGGIHGS